MAGNPRSNIWYSAHPEGGAALGGINGILRDDGSTDGALHPASTLIPGWIGVLRNATALFGTDELRAIAEITAGTTWHVRDGTGITVSEFSPTPVTIPYPPLAGWTVPNQVGPHSSIDPDGKLWVTAANGNDVALFAWDGATWARHPTGGNLFSHSFLTAPSDARKAGVVYYAENYSSGLGKLMAYNPVTQERTLVWNPATIAPILDYSDIRIVSICVLPSGNIVCGLGTVFASGTPRDALTGWYEIDGGVLPVPTLSAVRVATQANINLTPGLGALTIDGQTIVAGAEGVGTRVLVKAQTLAQNNGVYYRNAAGNFVRATGATTVAQLNIAVVFVTAGTDHDRHYAQTATILTVGTTAQVWQRASGGTQVAFNRFGYAPGRLSGATMVRDLTDTLWVGALGADFANDTWTTVDVKKVLSDGTVHAIYRPVTRVNHGAGSISAFVERLRVGPPLGGFPESSCDTFVGTVTAINPISDLVLSVEDDLLTGGAAAHRIELLANTTGHTIPLSSTLLSAGPWHLGAFDPGEKVVYRVMRIDGSPISGTATMRATNVANGITHDAQIACGSTSWHRNVRQFGGAGWL